MHLDTSKGHIYSLPFPNEDKHMQAFQHPPQSSETRQSCSKTPKSEKQPSACSFFRLKLTSCPPKIHWRHTGPLAPQRIFRKLRCPGNQSSFLTNPSFEGNSALRKKSRKPRHRTWRGEKGGNGQSSHYIFLRLPHRGRALPQGSVHCQNLQSSLVSSYPNSTKGLCGSTSSKGSLLSLSPRTSSLRKRSPFVPWLLCTKHASAPALPSLLICWETS